MNHTQAARSALRLTMLMASITAVTAPPTQAQSISGTQIPSNLKVPSGNEAFLKTSAAGTQNYICLPSGWTFIGPQATVFVTIQWVNGTVRQQVATHFLTPNPAEEGTNRPLWQSSIDSSIVWARQVDFSDDPKYVAPGAIPWLLLQAAGHLNGPSGGTMLSGTTFIQRVNTTGGLKPTSACSVGVREFVPYTADYVFYRKTSN